MSDEKSTDLRASTVMVDHWCEHPGCKKWGSFGFALGKAAPKWFCMEHRPASWPPAR